MFSLPVCMVCIYVCMYVQHVCAQSLKSSEEGVTSLGTVVRAVCRPPYKYSSPLQEE